MHTFRHVLEEVTPEIGTGLEPTSEKGRRYVRRAIQQILEVHPVLLWKMVRLYAYGNYLVLPTDIRRIKKYRFFGACERPQNMFYEFLDNGPGLLSEMKDAHSVLVDRGLTPVTYQPSKHLPVVVSSDRDEADAVITVQGKDAAGNIVRSENGTSGESILVEKGRVQIQSRLSFSEITSVSKPVTNGYVSLYSFDESTGALYLLAKYAPHETVGSFRRYRIPGSQFINDEPKVSTFDALALFHPPKLVHDEEIVPVGNILAIQFVARGIYLSGQRKYKEAQIESANGMSLAEQSIKLDFPVNGLPDIDGSDFMMGGIETL